MFSPLFVVDVRILIDLAAFYGFGQAAHWYLKLA